MKKITFLLIVLSLYCFKGNTQTTHVPDAIFEHYLETHDASGNVVSVGDSNSLGNGVDADTYITTSKIANLTTLAVNDLNIADLTGIEDFTSLTVLVASFNHLTTVDLSNNTNLSYLYINSNLLTGLNLNSNTSLISADLGYNNFSSIDLSNNTLLTTLSIRSNNISVLNLSMLPNFISLDCSYNQLTVLDVRNGNNTNFTRFISSGNPNLTCIFVDNATWSTTNWTDIDAATQHFVETEAACENILSVATNLVAIKFNIYPNPVQDILHIKSDKSKNLEVAIFDLLGKKVTHQKTTNGLITIDLQNIPSSNYFVKIISNNKNFYYKIIKK